NARAANAFTRDIKKLLTKPEKNWRLLDGENKDTWILNELKDGKKVKSYILNRA
ncbi:MAG: hypothetical protein HUJ11_05575, partial [Arenibacter algicola]|nr:hypothetical protein [Arenibacter algicola]